MKKLFFKIVTFFTCQILLVLSQSLFSQSVSLDWANKIQYSRNGSQPLMVTDSKGNMYIAGSFQKVMDADPGSGTYMITPAGNLDIFIIKVNTNGQFQWAKQIEGQQNELVESLIIDGSDNLCIKGLFEGSVDFDPDNGLKILTTTKSYSYFIAKYDDAGAVVWANQFDVSQMHNLDIDDNGNIYTAGAFEGKVDFDPSSGQYNMTAQLRDVFYLKMNNAGQFLWAISLLDQEQNYLIYNKNSIRVDGAGNIYTFGIFQKTIDFDPGAGVFQMTTVGNSQNIAQPDLFISKLNTNGSFLWAKQIAGLGAETPTDFILDVNGNPIITGNLYGNCDFDPGIGVNTIDDIGSFVVKYDVYGNLLWLDFYSGSMLNINLGINRITNNIYAYGDFENSMDFDPSANSVQNKTAVGKRDVFLLSLNSSGQYQWVLLFGGDSNETASNCNLDVLGNVYLTGGLTVNFDADPNQSQYVINSIDSTDCFLLKLSGTSLSMKENKTNLNKIQVYPNPNSGHFNLRAEANGLYQIYNNQGQLIKTIKAEGNNTMEVILEGVSPGVYFINGTTNQGLLTQKFIVF